MGIHPLTPRSLAETLVRLGLDPAPLTEGLGITLQDLSDPFFRLSEGQTLEIIRRGLMVGAGHPLGLQTGSRQGFTSLGLIGYAMVTSKTAGDAVNLALQFQDDAGGLLAFDIVTEGDMSAIVPRHHGYKPEIYSFLVEEAFSSFLCLGQGMVSDDFKPAWIEVTYPPPPHAEAYQELFGCTILFQQMRSAFVFASSWRLQPLKTADAQSNLLALRSIEDARPHRTVGANVVDRVRRLLAKNLQQPFGVGEVAQSLSMSERTLRRRLAKAGVTFQFLLDDVRKSRALELLTNDELSVERIGQIVGFNDPHNFRRAFRRWTGSSPNHYRP